MVLRDRIREDKAAAGRQLLDVPGYTYRVWVTNRTESALAIWRDYNGQAEGVFSRERSLLVEGGVSWLYEKGYCGQGNAENMIKQMVLDLDADRASCS